MAKAGDPPNFPSIHKRATDLVKNDAVLAWAVSAALRKSLIGHSAEVSRYELLSRVAYDAWNRFIELDTVKHDPLYSQRVLDLVTDTLIVTYDILTDTKRS